MSTAEGINQKDLKKEIAKLLEVAREDFRNIECTKKDRLLKLAKDIADLGCPKDMICETITKALENEIGESYIRKVLPKEFKRKHEKPVINENAPMSVVDDKNIIVQSSNGTQEIYKDDTAVPLEHQIKKKDQEIEQLKKEKEFETQRYVNLQSQVQDTKPVQQPKPVQQSSQKNYVDVDKRKLTNIERVHLRDENKFRIYFDDKHEATKVE